MENISLYKYKDYTQYLEEQIKANVRKINSSWVQEEDIKFLSNYIKNNNISYENILCHGTRQGYEQMYFLKYLQDIKYIIGTEISHNASNYAHTIQHDFHEIREDWVNKFDIVYSNSWDHSFDPYKSLNSWIKSTKLNGVLIIEWSTDCINIKISDPFGASLETYKQIFNKCNLKIIDILELNSHCNLNGVIHDKHKCFFILQKI